MIIDSIFISKKKGFKREEIEYGSLIKDFGLEGDSYSEKGAKRQITILDKASRDEVNNNNIEGLCFKKFQETLCLEGLPKLKEGDRISLGKAIIEILPIHKKCYPECLIRQSGQFCSLPKGVLFGKIIESGKIEQGMEIKIL